MQSTKFRLLEDLRGFKLSYIVILVTKAHHTFSPSFQSYFLGKKDPRTNITFRKLPLILKLDSFKLNI